MTHADIFEFIRACKLTVNFCPNEYAKAYAKAGIELRGHDAICSQSLYILNNMTHWRGAIATDCRVVFKRLGK